jgi:hypothetical protein
MPLNLLLARARRLGFIPGVLAADNGQDKAKS